MDEAQGSILEVVAEDGLVGAGGVALDQDAQFSQVALLDGVGEGGLEDGVGVEDALLHAVQDLGGDPETSDLVGGFEEEALVGGLGNPESVFEGLGGQGPHVEFALMFFEGEDHLSGKDGWGHSAGGKHRHVSSIHHFPNGPGPGGRGGLEPGQVQDAVGFVVEGVLGLQVEAIGVPRTAWATRGASFHEEETGALVVGALLDEVGDLDGDENGFVSLAMKRERAAPNLDPLLRFQGFEIGREHPISVPLGHLLGGEDLGAPSHRSGVAAEQAVHEFGHLEEDGFGVDVDHHGPAVASRGEACLFGIVALGGLEDFVGQQGSRLDEGGEDQFLEGFLSLLEGVWGLFQRVRSLLEGVWDFVLAWPLGALGLGLGPRGGGNQKEGDEEGRRNRERLGTCHSVLGKKSGKRESIGETGAGHPGSLGLRRFWRGKRKGGSTGEGAVSVALVGLVQGSGKRGG